MGDAGLVLQFGMNKTLPHVSTSVRNLTTDVCLKPHNFDAIHRINAECKSGTLGTFRYPIRLDVNYILA
jgi:hypothetical protein